MEQSWKYLVELECEKELAKPLSRENAKEGGAKMMPFVPPSKGFPIQGLKPAPTPKPTPPKRPKCSDCEYYNSFWHSCRIKRAMGLSLKGYCPKAFHKGDVSFHVRPTNGGKTLEARPLIRASEYKFSVHLNEEDRQLCIRCDFFDKLRKVCLLRRLGKDCIYLRRSAPRREVASQCRYCDFFDEVKQRCVLGYENGECCVYVEATKNGSRFILPTRVSR